MRRRSALAAAALLTVPVLIVSAVNTPVEAADPPSGFTDSAIADVNRATTVEWLPNSRIVVLEQESGQVRIAEPGGPLTTALEIDAVCGNGERGMLGFTHDPAFLGNGWVYVYYTHRGTNGCVNRVSRFTMSGATIDPATELVLLDNIASTGTNHNGGDLDFGSDGYLYVGIGDAGRDPRGDSGSNDAAQDLSLLNGKIARITGLGAPAPGNPFSGAGTAACRTSGTSASLAIRCQEIYSWGLRNPYRFAFDRNDGADTFFINDVGQSTFEEVDVGQIGNFGWPSREGACPQGQTQNCAAPLPGEIEPITQYGRDRGTYITAGAFVPDGLWPSVYDGAYLFGDGGSGNIWMRSATGTVDYDTPFATGAYGLTDMAFGFDADGTMVLYYVQVSGGLRMIKPNGVTGAPQRDDLKFVPITPMRPYDTGDSTGGPAGNVVNGTTRLIDLDAPAGARAALVNLTYDRTAGPGFVRAWAARTARPQTSALNADRANTIVANTAVVALADDGSFVLESSTTSRIIVDVMGWFVDSGGRSDDGRFVALDPARIVDTRIPAGGSLESGSSNPYTRTGAGVDVEVTGQLDVPDDGTVGAVVVSIGAIAADAGFVAGYPGGTPYNGTSNVNVRRGETRANMMVIPVANASFVSFRTVNVGDLVVDVLGYFTSDAAPPSDLGLFSTIAPTRTVDTRVSVGASTLQARRTVSVDTPAAARTASALVQNLTVTNTSAAGWGASHPGPNPPVVSNVNFEAKDQTRAALAFTTVGGGSVSYTSLVPTDLVVDVVGFFAGGTPVPNLDWKAIKDDLPQVPRCAEADGSDCLLVPGDGPTIFLIGDSHVRMLLPAIELIAEERDATLYVSHTGSCPWPETAYLGNVGSPRTDTCIERRARTYDSQLDAIDPDIVIVASRGRRPDSGLQPRSTDAAIVTEPAAAVLEMLVPRSADALTAGGRHVLLVEPVAEVLVDPLACLSDAEFQEQCVFDAATQTSEEAVYRRVAADRPDVVSLDLDEIVCPGVRLCPPIIDDVVVRRDDNHVTAAFAATLAPVFDSALVGAGWLSGRR